jgi:hypothetical protein
MTPELHPALIAAEVVVCVVDFVPVVTAVVAELELLAQTIAPLIHLVPEETGPMLTNTLLRQTDQLSPSEEH